jgi:DNA polymerase
MDKASQQQYLEAMGITVWVPRQIPGGLDLPVVATTDAPVQQPVMQVNRHLKDTNALALNHEWHVLQQQVAACTQCGLAASRTQTVFGVGNRHASWMLIGEAPGQHEDLQGEPFVGNAGQLLNEMLRAIGLSREEVYIANVVKCRPPQNRNPLAEEAEACHSFLQRQIALVQPKIILAVGLVAAHNLLNCTKSMRGLRGICHQLDNTPLIFIPHPAYLLRNLTEKAKAWEDLQFAVSVYKQLEK